MAYSNNQTSNHTPILN